MRQRPKTCVFFQDFLDFFEKLPISGQNRGLGRKDLRFSIFDLTLVRPWARQRGRADAIPTGLARCFPGAPGLSMTSAALLWWAFSPAELACSLS
jgi:hypothetical protein